MASKAADQNHKLAVCRLIDIYYDEQQYTKAGKLISVAINKFSYTNAYFIGLYSVIRG